MLVDTSIRLTDLAPAWGLVQMIAEDGTVEREYIISGAAVDEVNNGQRECPPGCTVEQWRTGRVAVFGRPLEPGLALIRGADKSLAVNFGVQRVGNRIKTNVMLVPAHQWELVGRDGIRLEARLAKMLDVGYSPVSPDEV